MREELFGDNLELHFLDEYRVVSLQIEHCPLCRSNTELVTWVENGRKRFAVRCAGMQCANTTPDFDFSDDAIRHWRLVAKLSK